MKRKATRAYLLDLCADIAAARECRDTYGIKFEDIASDERQKHWHLVAHIEYLAGEIERVENELRNNEKGKV